MDERVITQHDDLSFAFEARFQGTHVHVTVRAGYQEGSRALCGKLVMKPEEWSALRQTLEPAQPAITEGTAQ